MVVFVLRGFVVPSSRPQYVKWGGCLSPGSGLVWVSEPCLFFYFLPLSCYRCLLLSSSANMMCGCSLFLPLFFHILGLFFFISLYLSIINFCNDLPLRKMCRNLLFPFQLFTPFSSSCSMCLFYPRSIFLPLSLNFLFSPYIMIFLQFKCVGARSTPLPSPFFNFPSLFHIVFSSLQSVLLSLSLTFHPRFSS